MLKKIVTLQGIQIMNNLEQKSINGGDYNSNSQGCIIMSRSKCEGINGGVYIYDCCFIYAME